VPNKIGENLWSVATITDPEDPDNVLLDLGVDLCNQLGWEEGDQLEWIDQGNESFVLRKVESSSEDTQKN
jgi:hypothetical protein